MLLCFVTSITLQLIVLILLSIRTFSSMITLLAILISLTIFGNGLLHIYHIQLILFFFQYRFWLIRLALNKFIGVDVYQKFFKNIHELNDRFLIF